MRASKSTCCLHILCKICCIARIHKRCVPTHYHIYLLSIERQWFSLLTIKQASKHFCVHACSYYSVQYVSRFSGCRSTAAANWPVFILLRLRSSTSTTHMHWAPLRRRWLLVLLEKTNVFRSACEHAQVRTKNLSSESYVYLSKRIFLYLQTFWVFLLIIFYLYINKYVYVKCFK